MPTRDLASLSNSTWRQLNLIENAIEQEIMANYRAALEDIRAVLGALWEKHATGGILTKAEMTKYNRLRNLQNQLTEILGPQLSKNGRLVSRLAEVEYQESFFRHAWALEQHIGVELKWGMIQESVIRAAQKALDLDLARLANKAVTQEAIIGIRRVLMQNFIKGASYRDMARDVKHLLETSTAKALRIVRTEGQKAAVAGQLDNYDYARDKLGIEMRRFWVASLDDRTRPDHAAMDGQQADENDLFHLAGKAVEGPMDPQLPLEQIINCRCRVRAEVAEMPATLRRTREGGVEPYHTYSEWAKRHGVTKNRYGQKVAA